jgi:hypothetical protein
VPESPKNDCIKYSSSKIQQSALRKKNEARNRRHSIANTKYREMKKLDVKVPA